MSHALGVMCDVCHEVIIPDDECPERGCPGGHGFGHQRPSPWAANAFPDHPCFQEGGVG